MKTLEFSLGDLSFAAYRLPTGGIQVSIESDAGSCGAFKICESEWESLCVVARNLVAAERALIEIANVTGSPVDRSEECQRIARKHTGWRPF